MLGSGQRRPGRGAAQRSKRVVFWLFDSVTDDPVLPLTAHSGNGLSRLGTMLLVLALGVQHVHSGRVPRPIVRTMRRPGLCRKAASLAA